MRPLGLRPNMVEVNMDVNSVTPDKTHYGGWLKQLGVAALYALLLYLSELFFESDSVVSYFEPASGLAVAVLLLGGKRYAWGIFFGAALIHAIMGDSLREAAIVASSDTLQAFCGAWLLTRSKFDIRLQSMKDFLLLILLGGAISIFIGGLVMSMALRFSGLHAHGDYFHSLIEWWMSDTLGVILIAPMILTWWQAKENWRNKGQVAEALLLLSLTILVGQVAFFDWLRESIAQAPKAYWTFIPITWVAIRLGVRETTTALIVVAFMGLFGAVHGTGYFAYDFAHNHMLNYWIFMVTLSVVGMALATHIAERKMVEADLQTREAALVESHNLLKTIIDTAPVRIFWKDRELRYLGCNPLFARDAGEASPQNIIGRNDYQLGWKKQAEIYRADDRQVMDSGIPKLAYEEPQTTPDGKTIWLRTSKAPLRNIADETIGVLGIYQDITEHRLAQMKLQESETRLKEAQKIAHLGSWELNLRSNELWWSDETFQIFMIDQTKSSVSYEAFMNAVHPDDRETVNRAYNESVKNKTPYDITHRLLIPDGTVKWVNERCETYYDDQGKPLRSIGTVYDITERKRAEQLLRSKQELKAQQATAQKFSAHLQSVREEEKAAIAREIHDNLGSTLTALKMKIFQLKTGLQINKETMQSHELIRSMSQLINDASGIARHIITGLQPTMLNDLGLLAAIEWQAEQVQALSGIECMVNCIGDKGGLDQQRSIALFRIFQEALTNVVRHSSASRVEIEFHHSDEEVVMSVIDNGIGITNGHNNNSSHYGIHGMRERAALLGGTINFETPPGGGFGVTVILPLLVRKEDES